MGNVEKLLGHRIKYAKDEYEALDNADCLLICTEWSIFRNPDFAQVEDHLNNKVIFDGRNLYDLEKMRDLGFYYKSIGRETIYNQTEVPTS